MVRKELLDTTDVGAPNGVAPLDGAGRVPDAKLPTRLGEAGLSATFARRFSQFEYVAASIWGDSYAQGGYDSDAGTTFFDRIAARLRCSPVVNRGVGGTRSDQILTNQVLAFHTPNARGLHLIGDVILNDVGQYSDTTKTPTTAAAVDSIFAYLSSRYAVGASGTSLVYGPGWTSGVSSTAGAHVDISFDGDSCWIAYTAVTGAGGQFTIKNTAGSTVATVNTGGFAQTFTAVKKISGFDSGAHTVRVAVVSGTVTLAGMWLPSPTPPTIMWHRPNWNPNIGTLSRHNAYLAAVDAVAAGYTTVTSVTIPDLVWNASTMLGAGFHPNDYYNGLVADLAEPILAALPYRQGQNNLLYAFPRLAAPVYTPTTPIYTAPGATVAAAPAGVTVTAARQLTVAWTTADDGGATISSYEVQTSPDGTTWTTAASGLTPSTTSYTVLTGLTTSTAYSARVRAVNTVGNGAYGVSAGTAVAGAVVTTIAADNYNRADGAPGSTPTGSKAYALASPNTTLGSAAFAILSNRLRCNGIAASGAMYVVDAGVASGAVQATLYPGSGNGGLVFRATLDTGGIRVATGYEFYKNGSVYSLVKGAAAAFTNIGNSTGITPASGDVLRVVYNGTSIKCYVNGSLVISVTDSTYATGNYVGVYSGGASVEWDDFSVTDATT